jgi:hypothetical protein
VKTTLAIADILWTYLNNSSLKTAINGVVCKKRPIDSKKEDVVINVLFADNEQLQNSVCNVNIYAPNKVQGFTNEQENKVQDNTQPDFARLKTLTDLAVQLLEEQWFDGYWFRVQQVVGPIEDENNQHYTNIRIEFFNENL